MTRGAGLGTALLAALADPATWLLGLLAFLLRGGIVVVLAPIVILPTAVGLGNLFGPALTELALGDTIRGLLIVGLGSVAILVIWLAVAWGLASVAEAESIRRIAADEDLVATIGPARPARPGAAGRILIARVIALLPVILAIGVGGVRIVMVTYRELTLPSDTTVPLTIRVVGGATDAVVGIVIAWFVAELVGALAARRIVLGDAGVLGSLSGAIVDAIRHPVRVLIGSVVPTVALVAVLAALVVAAGPLWQAVRSALGDGGVELVGPLVVAVAVALWLAGLVLIGLVCAWRGAVWTVQVAGTFGGVTSTRPGELEVAAASATLSDLRPPGAGSDRGAS